MRFLLCTFEKLTTHLGHIRHNYKMMHFVHNNFGIQFGPKTFSMLPELLPHIVLCHRSQSFIRLILCIVTVAMVIKCLFHTCANKTIIEYDANGTNGKSRSRINQRHKSFCPYMCLCLSHRTVT